ncbi:hypothetical protein, partial [Serratia marcescens]|uniref:hypothetical protein n=1 Tax=Serratia marcescens TaxID=615 RepID=UPI0034D49926
MADDAVQLAAVDQRLEFLAGLVVLVIGGHVDIDRGRRIEVDRRVRGVLAIRADAAQRDQVADLGIDRHR